MSDGWKMEGWIAIYNGKRIEIRLEEADDLWGAQQIAMERLRVPKSKRGLLALAPGYSEENDENE